MRIAIETFPQGLQLSTFVALTIEQWNFDNTNTTPTLQYQRQHTLSPAPCSPFISLPFQRPFPLHRYQCGQRKRRGRVGKRAAFSSASYLAFIGELKSSKGFRRSAHFYGRRTIVSF